MRSSLRTPRWAMRCDRSSRSISAGSRLPSIIPLLSGASHAPLFSDGSRVRGGRRAVCGVLPDGGKDDCPTDSGDPARDTGAGPPAGGCTPRVRERACEMTSQPLLVPLDGSEVAETAMPYAEAVAGALRCPVGLLAVVTPLHRDGGPASAQRGVELQVEM